MKKRDWIAKIIASFLPQRLRYWVTMQVIADTTEKAPNIYDVNLEYILANAPRPKDLY